MPPIRDVAWFLCRAPAMSLADVHNRLSSTPGLLAREVGDAVTVSDPPDGASVRLRITRRDAGVTVNWIANHLEYVRDSKATRRRIDKLRSEAFDCCLQLAFDDLDRSTDALIETIASLRTHAGNGWTFYRWNSKLLDERDKTP